MAHIRPYRDTDLRAVYDVCVRTADAGGDARGMFSSDDLMPDLFAGPYVFLEPEFAFVLDDGERAVGYVLGTPDTAAFVRAHRERWMPRLDGRYPVPPQSPAGPPLMVRWSSTAAIRLCPVSPVAPRIAQKFDFRQIALQLSLLSVHWPDTSHAACVHAMECGPEIAIAPPVALEGGVATVTIRARSTAELAAAVERLRDRIARGDVARLFALFDEA